MADSTGKRSAKRRWASTLVGLVTLTISAIFMLRQRDLLLIISDNLNWAVAIFPLVLIMVSLNGLMLALFVRLSDIVLGPLESFGISVASSFANYVAPLSAGALARAGYLNRMYAFPYARFVVITAAHLLVIILVSGILGISLSIVGWISGQIVNQALLLFFTLAVAGSLALMTLPLNPDWLRRLPLGKFILQVLEGWKEIRGNFRLLFILTLMILTTHLAQGLALFFAFRVGGTLVSLPHATTIGLFLSLSTLARITPGNIGLQEALLGLAAALTGLPPESGVAAALVVRGARIIVIFTLGPLASYLLARR